MPVFVKHYLQAHCAFTDTVRRTTFKAVLARPIHDARVNVINARCCCASYLLYTTINTKVACPSRKNADKQVNFGVDPCMRSGHRTVAAKQQAQQQDNECCNALQRFLSEYQQTNKQYQDTKTGYKQTK
ncbi:unnamed protein product [Ceratitis capitata]|uniref:(Mediterranean fruit fly) hypothetical protein n=1 Tax=Ceratitis capitata TaxID=7213 RepID=A0A811U522_CERCA|nr:unnamed protein product [Ceratitis capitata]